MAAKSSTPPRLLRLVLRGHNTCQAATECAGLLPRSDTSPATIRFYLQGGAIFDIPLTPAAVADLEEGFRRHKVEVNSR